MISLPTRRAGLKACGLALAGLALCVGAACAHDAPADAAAVVAAAAPVINKGDNAWMLVSSALVLMMSIPGLALFYGGLVRTKNMLSVLTQVFAIVALIGVIWTLYGYSLAFGDGGPVTAYIGGLGKAFLNIAPEGKGVVDATVATFSNGVVIPELTYFVFQMTFAMITPALIVGAFAERIKFSAVLLFILLWSTLIYFPIAHWVWYVAAPDDVAAAAKALAAATDEAGKAAAQAKLDTVTQGVGWLAGGLAPWMGGVGALDFAGGTVVHINAGIAGLVGAIVIGKRIGYGREALPPHSLTMSMIGASLLWVGWFGFNAGSATSAGGRAGMAMAVTQIATAAAALAWIFAEWLDKGKPSVLGAISGAVAGLVAITPASGFVLPGASVVIGVAAGLFCYWASTWVKSLLGYDDSLDAFGVHGIGGIVGALLTGVFAYGPLTADKDHPNGVYIGGLEQLGHQVVAVGATITYTAVVTLLILLVVGATLGLRVTKDQEREGLDISLHGEQLG